MQDSHGRTINYLRLSITDRCNLRCRYCMPASGVPQKQHDDILRYEEMLQIVAAAAALGVRKVRVTGGEPLVRKGVISFLRQLSTVAGIEEIALTTNGMLLRQLAGELKKAGVKRINVSLDSLQEDRFSEITRGGSLQQVLDGLTEAERQGLKLKLNTVLMRGINDDEIFDFARLSQEHPWAVRYIEYMPTIRETDWQQRLVSGEDILAELQRHFPLQSISTGRYCGPARPYRIAGAKGSIGIITPMSDHFCHACNRIRVTATGRVKGCLFDQQAIDLKPYLGKGIVPLKSILESVINSKPTAHGMNSTETMAAPFAMSDIGG